TAVAVEAAMLAQVAAAQATSTDRPATPSGPALAARRRSGSAAGALVASVGALLLALRVDGADPADIGVAALLVAAAVVSVTSRPAIGPDTASAGGQDRGRPSMLS